jgi:ABC-2 type transport system permease protein
MATQKPAVEWIYDKLIYAQPNIVLSGKCTNSELLQAVIISVVIIIFANGIGNHAFNKVDIK